MQSADDVVNSSNINNAFEHTFDWLVSVDFESDLSEGLHSQNQFFCNKTPGRSEMRPPPVQQTTRCFLDIASEMA